MDAEEEPRPLQAAIDHSPEKDRRQRHRRRLEQFRLLKAQMDFQQNDVKATAGAKDSAKHTIGKDLHSPSTLARIGALQGASLLLGPFGFGVGAYEYMHKNGVDTSRVTAVEQISEEKTDPNRSTLIAALNDKDPAVRAAAAKALGTTYHDQEISDALLPIFDDSKRPVRLTAAAAYINATSPPHATHKRS